MKFINHKKIKNLLINILLEKNVDHEVALRTVNGLIYASLRGIDSHGIRLFFHYIQGIESGRINPQPNFIFEQTSSSTGILDADHTFGHSAGIKAMEFCNKLAYNSGSGHVAVKNSSHCGALSYFAQEASNKDMIGIAYTHATSRLKTSNGIREFFGNNPLCYDGANSIITFNEVRRCKDLGLDLPYGVVADANGEITTDPNKATQLIPIGDYKGFALSMIVDIFCGLLTGMPVGDEVSKMFGDSEILKKKRQLGQFYSSIKIDSFISKELFKERVQNLADKLRLEPAHELNYPIMVPGDPEKIRLEERLSAGIPVPISDFDRFKELEKQYLGEEIL
jgi:ureidoglycolate dehydrogenase (NAD+)